MPSKEAVIEVRGFKGINLREPENMVQDDELVECINFDIGRAGELKKRTGFATMHNGTTLPAASVRLLGQFITPVYSQLLMQAGTELYVTNDGITYELIGTFNTAFGVQYVDKFYMVQPDGLMLEWDGDGAQLLEEDTRFATSTTGTWVSIANTTGLIRDTVEFDEGVSSIKFTATAAAQTQVGTPQGIDSVYLVQPGQNVSFSGKIRPDTTTRDCELKALFWDVDGVALVALSSTETCANDVFTEVSASGVTPANARYAALLWEIDAPGAGQVFHIDSMSFRNASVREIKGSPSGTFASIHRDRMFVLNSDSTEEGYGNSTLYFSEINDFSATGWPSDNTILISPGDGDFLTCTAVIHDTLMVFKGTTTWGLYVLGDPANWILRNMNPEIGCISKYTPREIEGFLYFVGARGVYKTDGNIFDDISANIQPAFEQRIVNLTNANIDSAAWWEDKYIVLFNPTPSTKRWFVYHMRSGGWTEWTFTDIIPGYFVEVNTTTPGKGLWAGDIGLTGKVLKYGDEIRTDGGTEYPCTIQTKFFDFGIPSQMKRGKWLSVETEGVGEVSWEHWVENVLKFTRIFDSLTTRRGHKIAGPEYFRSWSSVAELLSDQDFILYGFSFYMHANSQLIVSGT